MKHFLFTLHSAVTLSLLTIPSLAIGQNQSGSEYPFIYSYDKETLYSTPTSKDIKPIQLYPLSDEMIIKKRTDVENDVLESLVKTYLPDAQFEWQYHPENVCSVITESNGLEEAINSLLKENIIISARKKYTRKTYKDLMDIYPVNEYATYGITDAISIQYLNEGSIIKANEMIHSMGFDVTPDDYNSNIAKVYVPKSTDILSVANTLYESGYFFTAIPIMVKRTKTVDIVPIDKSILPFYYGYGSGNNKNYLYELSDRFMVRKSPETEKSVMESIIKRFVDDSEIIWFDDNICTVFTNSQNISSSMDNLLRENLVLTVSHKYMFISDYENDLKQGIRDPKDFGFDGKIQLSFKEEVTDSIKSKIVADYKLLLLEQTNSYSEYQVPKTSDILSICNKIYETGNVKYASPNLVSQSSIIFWNSNTTTNTNSFSVGSDEIVTHYYDLHGRSIQSPSGMTIEVTRYKDGSFSIEKKLFR